MEGMKPADFGCDTHHEIKGLSANPRIKTFGVMNLKNEFPWFQEGICV